MRATLCWNRNRGSRSETSKKKSKSFYLGENVHWLTPPPSILLGVLDQKQAWASSLSSWSDDPCYCCLISNFIKSEKPDAWLLFEVKEIHHNQIPTSRISFLKALPFSPQETEDDCLLKEIKQHISEDIVNVLSDERLQAHAVQKMNSEQESAAPRSCRHPEAVEMKPVSQCYLLGQAWTRSWIWCSCNVMRATWPVTELSLFPAMISSRIRIHRESRENKKHTFLIKAYMMTESRPFRTEHMTWQLQLKSCAQNWAVIYPIHVALNIKCNTQHISWPKVRPSPSSERQ